MTDNSHCPKNKYCDFDVILSNDEIQIERCVFCNKKVSYNKVNGRIDEVQYLKDHARAFAQETGTTSRIYEQCYGKGSVAKLSKHHEDNQRKKRDLWIETTQVMESIKKGRFSVSK